MQNCSSSKINTTQIISNITCNITSNVTTDVTRNSITSRNIEIISLSIITLMIIVGNAMVILAYYTGPRRLRTRTNFFVINLAVSDIMVGLISVPFWITVLLSKYMFIKILLEADLISKRQQHGGEFNYP